MKLLSTSLDFCRTIAGKNDFLRGLFKIVYAKGGYKLFNSVMPKFIERKGILRACFIDVSGLVKKDAGTGIQRVARNLARELTKLLHNEVEVIPVWADIGAQGYFRAIMKFQGRKAIFYKTYEPLRPKKGDVFLGADHSAMIGLSQVNYLGELRARGVELNFICHDILPVRHPEWFMAGDSDVEKKWLKKFTPIARMICVSESVRDDLSKWLKENKIQPCKNPEWVHNGYEKKDFANSEEIPSIKLPDGKFALVVGTLEPRKGHAQVLAAFEMLWEEKVDLKLVFAGHPGWKVNMLYKKIKNHPELGKRFFWFDDCSDADLGILYENCRLVIVASLDEGFGLPVIEALGYGKEVICTDIPIFRELLGDLGIFFTGDELVKLLRDINIARDKDNKKVKFVKINNWSESINKIWNICNEDKCY